MGFFQDLREDLSQAVSEFTGEDKYKEEVVEEEDTNENVYITIRGLYARIFRW